MTTARAVKTSVTNNSLPKDYPHLDDHAKQRKCRQLALYCRYMKQHRMDFMRSTARYLSSFPSVTSGQRIWDKTKAEETRRLVRRVKDGTRHAHRPLKSIGATPLVDCHAEIWPSALVSKPQGSRIECSHPWRKYRHCRHGNCSTMCRVSKQSTFFRVIQVFFILSTVNQERVSFKV